MIIRKDQNRHYIKTCVDRRFKWNGQAFVWADPTYKFRITVEPTRTQTGADIVRVTMMDLITNTMIADWSHDVMCGEGDWRDRLQSLTGKLLIKAQHRPFCARCNAPLRVKTNKENSRQFFGCRNYQGGRGCRYTKDLDLAFEPNPRTASEANSGDQQSNANTDGFLKAGGPSAYTARQQQPPQQDRSQQQQP